MIPKNQNSPIDTSRTALFFAFDRKYITPFKVLLYSMARVGTMLKSPIIIYSDDPGVFEDRIVRLVVDKPGFISGDLKDCLYSMAEHNITRKHKAAWNRGTFLKWSAFENHGFDQVLFLDVDMLCLGPLEPFISLDGPEDLIACPQFQRYLVRDGEALLEAEKALRNLQRMLKGEFDGTHRIRINSGVMLLRKNVLSREFFEDITSFAKQNEYVNEQSHITEFFKKTKKYKMKLVESKFNFHEGYLNYIPRHHIDDFLKDTHILHYAGGGKPWKVETSAESRSSLLLWHRYREAAQLSTRIFGRKVA